MSNSQLISYTKLSPNCNKPRNKPIMKITPHHMAGNLSVESCGAMFASSGRNASSNYGIGSDGRIALYVNESDRAWTSSSAANDHQAVTIEVANDGGAPDWHVSDKALASLVNLCVDICERNNIPRLNFTGDANGNLTQHNYFAATGCPGPYLKSKFPYIETEVNKRLQKVEEPPITETTGLRATSLKDLSESDVISKIGQLFTADQKASGVLASVSLAQFILESGYGKSELAQNANNCFGMKASLSGNTWQGSVWGGEKYSKDTQEFKNGKYITVKADFRKYQNVEQSIADHSAYLLGAMNGGNPRYQGLKGCCEYKKAFQIIKDGGYATSPTYVEKLCAVVEKWNLTKFNTPSEPQPPTTTPTPPTESNDYPSVPFTVDIIVPDLNFHSNPSMSGTVNGQTGKGIFTIVQVEDGWGKLKSGAGWIWLENQTYCAIQSTVTETDTPLPYRVRVEITNLNIRKGPGVDYVTNGQTGIGVFTIVEVSSGEGAAKGWGKLKSGAGWISLDHVTKTD